jgi:hypothetical protein
MRCVVRVIFSGFTIVSLLMAVGLMACALTDWASGQALVHFSIERKDGEPLNVRIGRHLTMTQRGASVSFPNDSPIPASFAAGSGKPVDVRFLGFAHYIDVWGVSSHVNYYDSFEGFIIPLWFMLAITLALPAGRWIAVLRRWRQLRHRQVAGLCLQCGYDLRATPGKCPECGDPG